MVRRLPVLQSSSDDAPQRPPWHYLVIGAGFTVTLWFPLAVVALWVGGRVSQWMFESSERTLGVSSVIALQAVPLMLAYFSACLGSAVFVGRFGGKAGVREAVLGNLFGSAVVLGLALLAGGVGVAVAAAAGAFLAASSVLAGWAGARLGRRLRR